MKCEMRGIRGQPSMNLTLTLDRKHGGALACGWRDLLQTSCDLGDYLCCSFVRPCDREVGRYRHQLHPLEAFMRLHRVCATCETQSQHRTPGIREGARKMHKRRRFEAKCGDKEVGIHDINSDTSKEQRPLSGRTIKSETSNKRG